MYIRKDVMSMATRLSKISGINADIIYAWLMWTGKEKGRNPTLLPIVAISEKVYVAGEARKYYISEYTPYTED